MSLFLEFFLYFKHYLFLNTDDFDDENLFIVKGIVGMGFLNNYSHGEIMRSLLCISDNHDEYDNNKVYVI